MISNLEIDGADTLARTADRAADQLGDLDATAGAEAATDLARTAAHNAPRRTGQLAASHRAATNQVVVTAPYAGFVHWGTRHMRGRPWLTDTANRSTQWIDTYRDELDQIVDHIEGA